MTDKEIEAVAKEEQERRKKRRQEQVIALNTLITSLYILMLQGLYVRTVSIFEASLEKEINEALKTVLARYGNGVSTLLETGVKAAMRGDAAAYNMFIEALSKESGIKLEKIDLDSNAVIRSSLQSGGLPAGTSVPSTVYFATLEQVVAQVSGKVGNLVGAAIRANASVSDVVKAVMISMAPDNPKVIQYLSGLFGDMSRPAVAMREHLNFLGVPVADHAPIMNLYNSSRRLAISELSRAYYETDLYLYHNNPIVQAVKWVLNPLHPEYDVCDHLATFDGGMGEGIYPTALAPGLPHPYCGCYLEPVYFPQGVWANPPSKSQTMNYTSHPNREIMGATNNYSDRQYFFFKRSLAYRGGEKAINGL